MMLKTQVPTYAQTLAYQYSKTAQQKDPARDLAIF